MWSCKWGEHRPRNMLIANTLQVVFHWNSQPWRCTFKKLWSRCCNMVSYGYLRRGVTWRRWYFLKTMNCQCPANWVNVLASALPFCSPQKASYPSSDSAGLCEWATWELTFLGVLRLSLELSWTLSPANWWSPLARDVIAAKTWPVEKRDLEGST